MTAVNRNRLWLIALGAGIVAVLAGGWFVGVDPVLTQVSDANSQRIATIDANSAAQQKIDSLRTEFANIEALKSQLHALAESVPSTADNAVFLREIDSLTSFSGVKLQSVTLAVPIAYTPPVTAAPVPTSGAGTASSSSPSPSPRASGTASAATTNPTSAGPLGRLVLIPTQISVVGSYANVMEFVGGVQTGARQYLASAMNLSKNSSTGAFTAALTGWIYALPSTAQAAAVAESPMSSRTATPSPTSTPTASPAPNPSGSTAP